MIKNLILILLVIITFVSAFLWYNSSPDTTASIAPAQNTTLAKDGCVVYHTFFEAWAQTYFPGPYPAHPNIRSFSWLVQRSMNKMWYDLIIDIWGPTWTTNTTIPYMFLHTEGMLSQNETSAFASQLPLFLEGPSLLTSQQRVKYDAFVDRFRAKPTGSFTVETLIEVAMIHAHSVISDMNTQEWNAYTNAYGAEVGLNTHLIFRKMKGWGIYPTPYTTSFQYTPLIGQLSNAQPSSCMSFVPDGPVSAYTNTATKDAAIFALQKMRPVYQANVTEWMGRLNISADSVLSMTKRCLTNITDGYFEGPNYIRS